MSRLQGFIVTDNNCETLGQFQECLKSALSPIMLGTWADEDGPRFDLGWIYDGVRLPAKNGQIIWLSESGLNAEAKNGKNLLSGVDCYNNLSMPISTVVENLKFKTCFQIGPNIQRIEKLFKSGDGFITSIGVWSVRHDPICNSEQSKKSISESELKLTILKNFLSFISERKDGLVIGCQFFERPELDDVSDNAP